MRAAIHGKKAKNAINVRYFIGFLSILLTIIPLSTGFADQMVAGITANPAGTIAATPISIPRPIRLEKMQHLSEINMAGAATHAADAAGLAALHDVIDDCELLGLQGNEITLRVHYRVNPARPQPIYAGAWLYDANKQSIDAGYKPVAIAAFPQGSIDVVLVLPSEDFSSDYVETFLMESGQPVFINGPFKMPYSWKNGVLSEINSAKMNLKSEPHVPPLQSNMGFCQEYAATAVAQYNYATANKLPGIVPPVWSSDSAAHYSWCLGAPRENANQGNALRQAHIDRYKDVMQNKSSGQDSLDKGKWETIQALDKAKLVKPIPNKKLDPGLGP